MIVVTELSTEFLEQLLQGHPKLPDSDECAACHEEDCWSWRFASEALQGRYTLPSRNVVAVQEDDPRGAGDPRPAGRFVDHSSPTREQADRVLDLLQDRLSDRR